MPLLRRRSIRVQPIVLVAACLLAAVLVAGYRVCENCTLQQVVAIDVDAAALRRGARGT